MLLILFAILFRKSISLQNFRLYLDDYVYYIDLTKDIVNPVLHTDDNPTLFGQLLVTGSQEPNNVFLMDNYEMEFTIKHGKIHEYIVYKP